MKNATLKFAPTVHTVTDYSLSQIGRWLEQTTDALENRSAKSPATHPRSVLLASRYDVLAMAAQAKGVWADWCNLNSLPINHKAADFFTA